MKKFFFCLIAIANVPKTNKLRIKLWIRYSAKCPFYSPQSPIVTSAKSQQLHIIKLEPHSLDDEKRKKKRRFGRKKTQK
jgi:hypothetical protein